MGKSLEFFFDLMSPYSYLAATQLTALAQRTGAELRWRPLYLPGVMKATGNRGPTEVAAKAMYAFKDVNDWAKHYRLHEIILPDNFPFTAVLADRAAVVADEQGRCGEYTLAMFKTIWGERGDCTDPAVVSRVLKVVGLDPEAVLTRAGSEEVKAKLRANTDEAVERGAFGVPTFFVGMTEMFVGNDRLAFVEQALRR
jgi:2-hydroxychromene-2-carboxylate isomerase